VDGRRGKRCSRGLRYSVLCDNLQLEPRRFSPAGLALRRQPVVSRRLALHVLLWRYGPPPPVAQLLSSVSAQPNQCPMAGLSSTSTVTLSGPGIPAGGAVVISSSSATAATVPASVTVVCGSHQRDFYGPATSSVARVKLQSLYRRPMVAGPQTASLTVTPGFPPAHFPR